MVRKIQIPNPDDEALTRHLSRLLPAGVRGAVRRIRPDDADQLTAREAAEAGRAVDGVRRARGAARMLARCLCAQIGVPNVEILRAPGGAPIWPDGLVGSLSHDRDVAAAIVARADDHSGLGVDTEPAEPLEDGLVGLVALDTERITFGRHPLGFKLLFSVKEAVYKAVTPRDGVFLEFADVAVDLAARTAETCYGRRVQWRAGTHPRILAVAWW